MVSTVECYKAENLGMIDNRDSIHMSGKEYKYAIYSQPFNVFDTLLNGDYSACAFFNLDSKYTQLSGLIGHIDFSGTGTLGENDGGHVYDAEITIWGDNKEICSISLSANDPATSFNEFIEGVNILEFRIECTGNSKVGIADIQVR